MLVPFPVRHAFTVFDIAATRALDQDGILPSIYMIIGGAGEIVPRLSRAARVHLGHLLEEAYGQASDSAKNWEEWLPKGSSS
jgi:hypothetical protein